MERNDVMSAPLAFMPEPFELDEGYRSGFDEGEEDLFLGKIGRSLSRTVSTVGRVAGRGVKTVVPASIRRTVERAGRTAGGVVRGIDKTVSKVAKYTPLPYVAKALSRTPLGMAVKAGVGGLTAAAKGENFFKGAARSLKSDPLLGFVANVASGQNVLRAAQQAAKAGINDVREQLRFAQMVAPFIPGIGTGVAAALGAANALAAGRPITAALIEAARSAVPGGVVAQAAFDMAVNLAKGKTLTQAALETARNRLPGGPAAQAAFDTAVALSQGKRIQEAALAGAGRVLPPSPYAADALSFAKSVAAGRNLQQAALSTAGNRVLQRMNREVGELESSSFPHMSEEFEEERGRMARSLRRSGLAADHMRGAKPKFRDEPLGKRGGSRFSPFAKRTPYSLQPRDSYQLPQVSMAVEEPNSSSNDLNPHESQCQPPIVLAGFDVGKAQLKPNHYTLLTQLVQALGKPSRECVVTVEGHTDGSSHEGAMKSLSQKRAFAVARILSEGGLNVNLNIRPYNAGRPVASNVTSVGRQQNRRVVLRSCRCE